MKEVGLYQAKTQLSALVAEVAATGDGIALTKHGEVVAEIHPPGKPSAQAGMPQVGQVSDGIGFRFGCAWL